MSPILNVLINGPFVPHINSWEPCYFAKVPDGPQTYTLGILWLQKEEARYTYLSEAKTSHSHRTQNVGRGFILCSTPSTQWTV